MLYTTNDYEDEDFVTSEIIRINKAMRMLSDLIGRCGIKFYLISVTNQIKVYYEAEAHPLVHIVLAGQLYKINFIN